MLRQPTEGTILAGKNDKACILELNQMYHVVLLGEYDIHGLARRPSNAGQLAFHVSILTAGTGSESDAVTHLTDFAVRHEVSAERVYEEPIKVESLKGQWYFMSRQEGPAELTRIY